ncbi:hypothetical protein [Streptomyces phaeoluteigriseus]|uniref:hypothetical protein n=1 Tax=Streptomyces phaeoluteigriseus TaxID=114686 RepID=UPI0036C67C5C
MTSIFSVLQEVNTFSSRLREKFTAVELLTSKLEGIVSAALLLPSGVSGVDQCAT